MGFDNINPLNLDVVDLDNDVNPELDVEEMAEERTLIPNPFGGSPARHDWSSSEESF